MCVIVAKYLQDGWVLAKNRDQTYVSTLEFVHEPDQKVGEIFYFDDQYMQYKEGMNHRGLAIITTSLSPLIAVESNADDGENIVKALHLSDPMEAAKYLVSKEMTGYIFCMTPDKLVLVEAARKNTQDGKQGEGVYVSRIRIVPTSETVVRTNHGIELPWAGFQMGYSDTQDLWRKSSETRKAIAERLTKNSKNAEEMLNALAAPDNKDPQLNVFRIETKPRQMRTIFQWALVPKTSEVYIRPVQTKMELDLTKGKFKIKVIDNQSLQKTYSGRIKHFTKVETENGGKIAKAVLEGFLSFKNWRPRRDSNPQPRE